MQHGVIRRSDFITDEDVAFAVKAVNKQGLEFAKDWGLSEPGPLAFYTSEDGLPGGGRVRIVSLVDDVSMAGVKGFHDAWAGEISAQVGVDAAWTVTLSHEHLEMMGNPLLVRWATMPDGRSTPWEACDAVQADTYLENVELFGRRRDIALSNYLLPSWFDSRGKYPFDRMGKLEAPFSMVPNGGGYLIVRGQDRRISNVFAKGAPANLGSKLADPVSRLNLIRAGGA
jgi:hypothetical protein